ncbi:MAG: hypothetical protein PHP42_11750, partial [Bacteroidota bacterium]|nr:hypothetical protein [Bacteroidota bacterium]
LVLNPYGIAAPLMEKLYPLILRSKHLCILLNTRQAGAEMLPPLTKVLLENKQWSVIETSLDETGLIVLSCKDEDKPALPKKRTLAPTFLKAVVRHIATGMHHVDKDTLQRRLEQCSICPLRVENRCALCGCYLVEGIGGIGKAEWADQECPLHLWENVNGT